MAPCLTSGDWGFPPPEGMASVSREGCFGDVFPIEPSLRGHSLCPSRCVICGGAAGAPHALIYILSYDTPTLLLPLWGCKFAPPLCKSNTTSSRDNEIYSIRLNQWYGLRCGALVGPLCRWIAQRQGRSKRPSLGAQSRAAPHHWFTQKFSGTSVLCWAHPSDSYSACAPTSIVPWKYQSGVWGVLANQSDVSWHLMLKNEELVPQGWGQDVHRSSWPHPRSRKDGFDIDVSYNNLLPLLNTRLLRRASVKTKPLPSHYTRDGVWKGVVCKGAGLETMWNAARGTPP